MTEQPEWTQPDRVTLLTGVRDIVRDNPGRWYQGAWVDNKFGSTDPLPVEDIRPYATEDMPDHPVSAEVPVCGTTGCVAGWIAILGSPPGTIIFNSGVRLPDGVLRSVSEQAGGLAGLNWEQRSWLFSGDRDRDEVLAGLDMLIEDPDAELGVPETVTRTITVTVSSEGGEIWSRSFEITRDPHDSNWDFAEDALQKAASVH